MGHKLACQQMLGSTGELGTELCYDQTFENRACPVRTDGRRGPEAVSLGETWCRPGPQAQQSGKPQAPDLMGTPVMGAERGVGFQGR